MAGPETVQAYSNLRVEAQGVKEPASRGFGKSTKSPGTDVDFVMIQREGSVKMRRGSLSDLQDSLNHLRGSQKDVFQTLKDVRRASQEMNLRLDIDMRRFSVASNAVKRMSERSANAKATNFVRGSKEFDNWQKLRTHTTQVIKNIRKSKLEQDVLDMKERLQNGERKAL